MKLELKHLAPYLPYNLKMMSGYYLVGLSNCDPEKYKEHDSRMMILSETPRGSWQWEAHADMDKPILRPLSDLTKEIEHNGEKFVPFAYLRDHVFKTSSFDTELKIDEAGDMYLSSTQITRYLYPKNYPFWLYEFLISWHFDVFALIDSGLAVDINTLD